MIVGDYDVAHLVGVRSASLGGEVAALLTGGRGAHCLGNLGADVFNNIQCTHQATHSETLVSRSWSTDLLGNLSWSDLASGVRNIQAHFPGLGSTESLLHREAMRSMVSMAPGGHIIEAVLGR